MVVPPSLLCLTPPTELFKKVKTTSTWDDGAGLPYVVKTTTYLLY
jgi:hypothetical protein